MTKISEFLSQKKSLETLKPNTLYSLLGVRLEGKGCFIREQKFSSQIRAERLQRVKAGDFIYSRLFAWRGAFAIVPSQMDGAYVSNEFPNFEINHGIVDPQFIEYYFKQSKIWRKVEKLCSGTTKASRNRFKEKFFLNLEISLPPIAEQKERIARINKVIPKIDQTIMLKDQTLNVESMRTAIRTEVFTHESVYSGKLKNLFEVARVNMGQSPPGESYNKFGEGVPLLNGPTEFGKKYPLTNQWTIMPTKLCEEGDILICVRGATTGRMNWADKKYCIGRGLAALTPIKDLCLPEYLYFFVETQTRLILSLTAGTTFPNLQSSKLRALKIPLPSLLKQQRIVDYFNEIENKFEDYQRIQGEIQEKNKILLPSLLEDAFKA